MAKVVRHHRFVNNEHLGYANPKDHFFYVEVDGLEDEDKVLEWCEKNLTPNYQAAPSQAKLLRSSGAPFLPASYMLLITMDADNGMIFKLTWM